MSIERVESGYRVRWREAARGSRRRSRSFARRKDAERFEAEIKRRRALGELALLEAASKPVSELAERWWAHYAVPNLADWTLRSTRACSTRT